jgi:serine/threonine protein kinase
MDIQHPFLTKENLRRAFTTYFDPKKFKGRNSGLREIVKSETDGLVLQRIQIPNIRENYKILSNLKHENIEIILNMVEDEDFLFFTTYFYVDCLEKVWENKDNYNIVNIFSDCHQALSFLKSKNICHGAIHERNIAFNGKVWYISGLITSDKTGECKSGEYVTSCYKSRQYLLNNVSVPSDDMWQLVFMYVITYYGFNPFMSEIKYEIFCNILKGKCKIISFNNYSSNFGKKLYNILTRKYEAYDYDDILEIFKTNTDDSKKIYTTLKIKHGL